MEETRVPDLEHVHHPLWFIARTGSQMHADPVCFIFVRPATWEVHQELVHVTKHTGRSVKHKSEGDADRQEQHLPCQILRRMPSQHMCHLMRQHRCTRALSASDNFSTRSHSSVMWLKEPLNIHWSCLHGVLALQKVCVCTGSALGAHQQAHFDWTEDPLFLHQRHNLDTMKAGDSHTRPTNMISEPVNTSTWPPGAAMALTIGWSTTVTVHSMSFKCAGKPSRLPIC